MNAKTIHLGDGNHQEITAETFNNFLKEIDNKNSLSDIEKNNYKEQIKKLAEKSLSHLPKFLNHLSDLNS